MIQKDTMKKSERARIEPSKITIGVLVKVLVKIFAWIVAIIFILASIQAFSTSRFIYGATTLIVGLIILPLFNNLLRRYANIELSWGIKVIIVLVVLLLIGLLDTGQVEKTDTSGSNFETAIVVNANNEKTGVAWEYQYLRANACKKSGLRDVLKQTLEKHNGHMYDRIVVACRDNINEAYYFNIDSFFGKSK